MKRLGILTCLVVLAFAGGCIIPRGYEATIHMNPTPIVRYFDVASGQEISMDEAEQRLTRVVTAVLKDPDVATLVILAALVGYEDDGSNLGKLAVAARSDAGLRTTRGGREHAWQHSVVMGFVDLSSAVDLNRCPAGTSFVYERQTIGHLLGFLLTAGLWGPTTVELVCTAPPR